LAVLEKRLGFQLFKCDVFVSIAGGMKITEPAIDLGVLVSIASSFLNRKVDPETTVVGEVGLGGELRSVSRLESRIKEAIHMGFCRCVVPRRNLKGISEEIAKKITLIGVDVVDEAVRALLS
jgi:DNA repair protein RadA/Sms